MPLSKITIQDLYKLGSANQLGDKIRKLEYTPIKGVYVDSVHDHIKIVFDAQHITVTLDETDGLLKQSCTSCVDNLQYESSCPHIIMAVAAYFIAVKNFQSLINFRINSDYFESLKYQFLRPDNYFEFLARRNQPKFPTKEENSLSLDSKSKIIPFNPFTAEDNYGFENIRNRPLESEFDIEFSNDPELGIELEILSDEIPKDVLKTIGKYTDHDYMDILTLKEKNSLTKILKELPEFIRPSWYLNDDELWDEDEFALKLLQNKGDFSFKIQVYKNIEFNVDCCELVIVDKNNREIKSNYFINKYGDTIIIDAKNTNENCAYLLDSVPNAFVATSFIKWFENSSFTSFHPLFFRSGLEFLDIMMLSLYKEIAQETKNKFNKLLPSISDCEGTTYDLINTKQEDVLFYLKISPQFSVATESYFDISFSAIADDIEFDAFAPIYHWVLDFLNLYEKHYTFLRAKTRRSLFVAKINEVLIHKRQTGAWPNTIEIENEELSDLVSSLLFICRKEPRCFYLFDKQHCKILEIENRTEVYLDFLLNIYSDLKELTLQDQLFSSGKLRVSTSQKSNTEQINSILIAAQRYGFNLQLNGKKVQNSRLKIQVDVTNNKKKIDWFELKTDVKVDNFSLSQKEWQKILGSETGLIEIDQQHYIIDIKSREQLDSVNRILSREGQQKDQSNKKSEALLEYNRLQIFDWLPMIAEGKLDIHLPEELESIVQSLKNFKKIPAVHLPDNLKETLRPYQRKGVNWLAFHYKHKFGACLADDMGLGKTLQVIAFISYLNAQKSSQNKKSEHGPSIIVVPPSLVFNWLSEFQKFAPNIKVADYIGNARTMDIFRENNVIITTYDILRIDIKQFQKITFHIAVFDEAQNLKNFQASRTKAALQLKALFRVCLTGTPLENNISEYFSIMSIAIPGIMESHDEFRARYNAGDNTLIKRAEIFLLRRTKENILKDLPAKQESNIYLNMGEKQREYYTRFAQAIKGEIEDAYAKKTKAQANIIALTAITRLRQVCVSPLLTDPGYKNNSPKLDYLADKLNELSLEGHASLVFSQFTKALDAIENILQSRKIKYLRIDGKVPTAKRKNIVQAFQESEEYPVFLISLKTGGVGLNLTRANYVFHVDPWWNPAVENQATDRAHRIGQTKKVMIQRLLMRNSIEEKMIALKKDKQDLFDEIINANEKKSKSGLLSKEQILQLIS